MFAGLLALSFREREREGGYFLFLCSLGDLDLGWFGLGMDVRM